MWIRKKKIQHIDQLLKNIATNLMLLNVVTIQNIKTKHDPLDYIECGFDRAKNKFIMN